MASEGDVALQAALNDRFLEFREIASMPVFLPTDDHSVEAGHAGLQACDQIDEVIVSLEPADPPRQDEQPLALQAGILLGPTPRPRLVSTVARRMERGVDPPVNRRDRNVGVVLSHDVPGNRVRHGDDMFHPGHDGTVAADTVETMKGTHQMRPGRRIHPAPRQIPHPGRQP